MFVEQIWTKLGKTTFNAKMFIYTNPENLFKKVRVKLYMCMCMFKRFHFNCTCMSDFRMNKWANRVYMQREKLFQSSDFICAMLVWNDSSA